MGRKSFSVDLVNSYVVENFKSFAWCNHYGTTEPQSKNGVFFFYVIVHPNDYARPTIPSSNNLMLPEVSVESNYTIFIPMVSGSQQTKNGKPLDKDALLKFRYFRELSENVIRAIDKLDPRTTWSHIDCSSDVFGVNKGWERVTAYEIGMQKKYWSILSHKTKEEMEDYEKQIANGNNLIQAGRS